MSKIIKGNQAKAIDFRTIEAIKLPVFTEEEFENNKQVEPLTPEQILEQAQLEKNKIIEAAQREAEAIKEQMKLEGYNEGFKKGYTEGQSRIDSLESKFNTQFNSIIEQFETEKEIILKQASVEVQEIALYIVKKLVGDLIEEKDDLVLDFYRMLHPLVTEKSIKEIMVNPNDYQTILDYLTFTNKNGIYKLSISEEISKGALQIHTEQGFVIKDLQRQLNEIIDELRRLNG